jgi:hypothetical protein
MSRQSGREPVEPPAGEKQITMGAAFSFWSLGVVIMVDHREFTQPIPNKTNWV